MRKIVIDDQQIERALKHLSNKAADRVATAALRGGLRALTKAEREAAPVGETKALKKSIGGRLEKNRGGFLEMAKAGIGVGKSKPGKARAPHAHLVALGTKPRFHKSGKSTGRMPANPFIKEAAQSSQAAQKTLMAQRASKALDREAKKARSA